MTTAERIQFALLQRTTKARHRREATCHEWREAGPAQYVVPSGAARALSLVAVCAVFLWAALIVWCIAELFPL